MTKRIRAGIKVYYFYVGRDELIRRLRERNKNLPKHSFHLEENTIDEALKHFESPTPEEPDSILVS